MNQAAIDYSLIAILLFGGGWYTKGKFDKAADYEKSEAIKEAVVAFRAQEEKTSKALEDKLASLKANERVIEREKIQLVDRPVYRNECLDSSGVLLINAARLGKDPASQPATDLPRTK